MGNLTNIPLEQNYEEELTQPLSASVTEVYVKAVPSFIFPAGASVDFIINPGKTNEETITVTAIDTVNKKLTISARNVSRGAGVTSTAQTHSVGSTIIISNGYNLWLSTQSAINSKINNDGSGVGTSFDLQVSGSNFRIRKDGNDMKLRDDNNNEITLSQLSALSGSDTKVAISVNDTTPSQLESKLIAGDGISLTKGNAGGNETLTGAIELDTNSGLEFNSGKLKAKSSSTTQKGIVEMATDAEVTTGTDEEKYVNPKQLKDNTVTLLSKSLTFVAVGYNSQSYSQTITHNLGVPFTTMIARQEGSSFHGYYCRGIQYCIDGQGNKTSNAIGKNGSSNLGKISISNITDTTFTYTHEQTSTGVQQTSFSVIINNS